MAYSENNLWYYQPNKAAPIAFMILFLISGICHFYQTQRYHSWRYTLLMPWAALLFVGGFAVREAGAYNTGNLNLVIATNALIMSGPPVYAAIDYLVLSRIMFYLPYLAPMHPGRVITTFLGLDAIIEALIVNGAVRLSNSSLPASTRETGATLVKVSLIAQALMFLVFIALCILFQLRGKRAGVLNPRLDTVFWTLYASATLITTRCIYRIVEFFQGWDGEINTHEPYFWVFEASIMLLNTCVFNLWHPGQRLPRSNSVYLSPDGQTELQGLGWEDDRPFLVSMFDPFDLWGLIRGKDKETAFWNMSQEEIIRRRAERKANKRRWYLNLLDPFKLAGPNGYVARWRGKAGTGRSGSVAESTVVNEAHTAKGVA
ncbi:hypothetical protein M501DRAFT_996060 [Patellaria atrata CBS 101060]|uniref:RTA1 domain protein n=1 Tax=Patellaria atrata CBS 101060 TaxID=1346257 RepID=A0A9P4S6A6_9PEZI|nr:hypothetical protein M501DRAFT_996060 [Patellaria atrata CBS 101060]